MITSGHLNRGAHTVHEKGHPTQVRDIPVLLTFVSEGGRVALLVMMRHVQLALMGRDV